MELIDFYKNCNSGCTPQHLQEASTAMEAPLQQHHHKYGIMESFSSLMGFVT